MQHQHTQVLTTKDAVVIGTTILQTRPECPQPRPNYKEVRRHTLETRGPNPPCHPSGAESYHSEDTEEYGVEPDVAAGSDFVADYTV